MVLSYVPQDGGGLSFIADGGGLSFIATNVHVNHSKIENCTATVQNAALAQLWLLQLCCSI
eukprot:1849231-Pleurochrysis_carterae.AAC.4